MLRISCCVLKHDTQVRKSNNFCHIYETIYWHKMKHHQEQKGKLENRHGDKYCLFHHILKLNF